MSNSLQMGTRAVWAGEEEYLMQGATQVPIVHSVSFGYRDMDEWLKVALGQKEGHIYSRNTNPTVQAFEEKIRNLEDAEAVTSAATGMGIPESLVRYSTGIEDTEDLLTDLEQALRPFA